MWWQCVVCGWNGFDAAGLSWWSGVAAQDSWEGAPARDGGGRRGTRHAARGGIHGMLSPLSRRRVLKWQLAQLLGGPSPASCALARPHSQHTCPSRRGVMQATCLLAGADATHVRMDRTGAPHVTCQACKHVMGWVQHKVGARHTRYGQSCIDIITYYQLHLAAQTHSTVHTHT